MYYATDYDSPVGRLVVASDGASITGLWIEGQKYFAATAKGELKQAGGREELVRATAWLDAYFAHDKPAVEDLPLAPEGSEFRQMVWRILISIPYGATMTYGQIAQTIARQTSESNAAGKADRPRVAAQAVGGAVGHNPISIIIPCHRVIGADGSLTGYAGGIQKKIWLLEHEKTDMTQLFVPSRGTAL